jgi:hypothetical protein
VIPQDAPAHREQIDDQPQPRPRIDTATLLPDPSHHRRRRDVIDALARPSHRPGEHC